MVADPDNPHRAVVYMVEACAAAGCDNILAHEWFHAIGYFKGRGTLGRGSNVSPVCGNFYNPAREACASFHEGIYLDERVASNKSESKP
jgi:hypothetical protein